MNYGELKNYFKELLNRTDATDTQVDMFISLGLRRTERVLRTTLQKQPFSFTVPADYVGYVPVPSDYLGVHSMKVAGLPMQRISDVSGGVAAQGEADSYFLENGKFYFRPTVNEGDVIDLIYYCELTEAATDETITRATLVIPDVIIYAALVFACDFFTDMRKQDFGSTLAILVSEVQMFSDQDELTGMAVANPYAGMC